MCDFHYFTIMQSWWCSQTYYRCKTIEHKISMGDPLTITFSIRPLALHFMFSLFTKKYYTTHYFIIFLSFVTIRRQWRWWFIACYFYCLVSLSSSFYIFLLCTYSYVILMTYYSCCLRVLCRVTLHFYPSCMALVFTNTLLTVWEIKVIILINCMSTQALESTCTRKYICMYHMIFNIVLLPVHYNNVDVFMTLCSCL